MSTHLTPAALASMRAEALRLQAYCAELAASETPCLPGAWLVPALNRLIAEVGGFDFPGDRETRLEWLHIARDCMASVKAAKDTQEEAEEAARSLGRFLEIAVLPAAEDIAEAA